MVQVPILRKEVLQYLDPKPNENFIDCTIGEGGHALVILERIKPQGKLLGIDWDREQIKKLELRIRKKALGKRLVLVCDNFVNLQKIVQKYNFKPIHGILFDLGMSSWHLEESGRGFSFLRDEPLVMRYCHDHENDNDNDNDNNHKKLTAEEIVNKWSEKDLERILQEYGEERFAARIAKQIVSTRKLKAIKTTFELAAVVKRAVPHRHRHFRIHPATKTFQALRIAVNDELENLKKGITVAFEILSLQGRLVVISFHSLEDRIVKNFFRERVKENRAIVLTKKPITASARELSQNPRARSAKLRALKKLVTSNQYL